MLSKMGIPQTDTGQPDGNQEDSFSHMREPLVNGTRTVMAEIAHIHTQQTNASRDFRLAYRDAYVLADGIAGTGSDVPQTAHKALAPWLGGGLSLIGFIVFLNNINNDTFDGPAFKIGGIALAIAGATLGVSGFLAGTLMQLCASAMACILSRSMNCRLDLNSGLLAMRRSGPVTEQKQDLFDRPAALLG